MPRNETVARQTRNSVRNASMFRTRDAWNAHKMAIGTGVLDPCRGKAHLHIRHAKEDDFVSLMITAGSDGVEGVVTAWVGKGDVPERLWA